MRSHWWEFRLYDYVCIGHITTSSYTGKPGRWIVWDLPWTEDVRLYDAPMRFSYFGRKYCWRFGAKSQVWDWERSVYTAKWARFSCHPRDYRERWDKAGRPDHPWSKTYKQNVF